MIVLTPEGMTIDGQTFQYPEKWSLTASTDSMTVPREAMGFGDVKFIGCIGAFLGPASIFFVILVSSLVGAATGLILLSIGKREWGGKLPYGPFLAFAAVLWVFFDFLAPGTAEYYREMIRALVSQD
jgi:leader peptidase (prepilin peptidase)/N-methyltransferase